MNKLVISYLFLFLTRISIIPEATRIARLSSTEQRKTSLLFISMICRGHNSFSKISYCINKGVQGEDFGHQLDPWGASPNFIGVPRHYF